MSKLNAPMKSSFPTCVLDRSLVNGGTLDSMTNVDFSILAGACGKNRGAFVLDPPDGHTYSCLDLPDGLLESLGIDDTCQGGKFDSRTDTNTSVVEHFTVKMTTDISEQYKLRNLTATAAVDLYDFIVQRTYAAIGEAALKEMPYGCDINGLATLENCGGANRPPRSPIRAATMAGMFAPALWATNGTLLTAKEAADFYTIFDFLEMKKVGLNMVQIPVDLEIFDNNRRANHWIRLLADLLTKGVGPAKMKAIIELKHLGPEKELPVTLLQAVESAAHFCNEAAIKAVVHALTLPSTGPAVITAALAAEVPLWLSVQQGDLPRLREFAQKVPQANIQAVALDLSHISSVADVASSSSEEDRSKLFHQESIACLRRAPIEYAACYQDMPVFVSNGFDLAIDNCHLKDYDKSGTFQDYGQCGRLHETKKSKWWLDHRMSFAQRQMSAYEKGLGWSFTAWKLHSNNWTYYGLHELGIINGPSKLLSFRDTTHAGLLPNMTNLDDNLDWTDDDDWEVEYPRQNPKIPKAPVGMICLNPPEADFVLGDETFAPTPAPPPDCGRGWWNYSTEKCDYWIPPEKRAGWVNLTATSPVVCPNFTMSCPKTIVSCPHYSTNARWRYPIVEGFVIGVIAAAFVAFVSYLGCLRQRRYTYQMIPSSRV